MQQFKNQVSRTLRPGARPNQITMKLAGSWVDNQLVMLSIRQLLDVEFNVPGYEYITHELKKEYLINKKKVSVARCTGS